MSTQEKPYVSIVIPCWNEQKNLENDVLDEVYAYLQERDFAWQVIIVDDGSSDDSKRLVQNFIQGKPGFSLVEIPHGGKPTAVWAGIQRAEGEIVLFADMDQSTPINELDKLLPCYDQGFDVVIGSRGIAREGTLLVRQAGSFAFLTLRRLVLLRSIRDTQCGFKSCRRQVAVQIFPKLQYFRQAGKPTGWKVSAYDVEFLYLAERAGYRIKEVVVRWRNRDLSDTKSQQSDLMRYVHESIEMGKEIFRVKRNQIKGFYDQDNG